MQTGTADPIIKMQNVSKFFDAFQALKDVSLDVREGERVVVCGPSGSGKSTLIRCINRLEKHEQGEIEVDGIRLNDSAAALDAIRRNVGMVFQQFNLFPHLSVIDNLTLGPMRAYGLSRRVQRNTLSGCAFLIRLKNCQSSFLAASNNASRLPARSAWSRAYCSLMNRPLRLILR